ncbi:MAG: transposase [Bacteroidales bacterium]|nr:transposase [Bacteroidales bacterium]
MRRTVSRLMPDGSIRYVQPYHVSVEGLQKVVLCRDEEDYDAFVKIICVCAKRKNVIVIIYAVVSNHCHAGILSSTQSDADEFAQEIKRMYSMWFSRKYRMHGTMKKVDVKAIYLDSDWYVRNALAYIPRNALDNGCNVNDYPWSGYNAMFSRKPVEKCGTKQVRLLHKAEKRRIMHTGDDLSGVGWLLDKDDHLIPGSICDNEYLEQVFNNDHDFFLKTVGGQNSPEMKFKLIECPRAMHRDNDFLKVAEEYSERWFQTSLDNLSKERRIRLIPYLFRTMKTSIPQLSRVFGIGREELSDILRQKQ